MQNEKQSLKNEILELKHNISEHNATITSTQDLNWITRFREKILLNMKLSIYNNIK